MNLGLADGLDVVKNLLSLLVSTLGLIFFVRDGDLLENFTLELVAKMFSAEALSSRTFESTEMEFGEVEEIVPDLTEFLLLCSRITSEGSIDFSVFSNS